MRLQGIVLVSAITIQAMPSTPCNAIRIFEKMRLRNYMQKVHGLTSKERAR